MEKVKYLEKTCHNCVHSCSEHPITGEYLACKCLGVDSFKADKQDKAEITNCKHWEGK